MPLKIFISSEMLTKEDLSRRKYAKKALTDLGHFPVMFEDFAVRPLADIERTALDPCTQEVKKCDLLMGIIDDEISRGMKEEIEAAIIHLGKKKIFLYFHDIPNANASVSSLWTDFKNFAIINKFKTVREFKSSILKSSAYFIAASKIGEPKTLWEETITLAPHGEKHQPFYIEKGNEVIVSIIADGNIYAGLFSREEYMRLRGRGDFGSFPFSPGTDRPQYSKKFIIKESDDYYVIIRVSMWSETRKILVKIIQICPG